MRIVLIQLSDLHCTTNKPGGNPLISRIPALCGAIRSALSPSDQCILLFSGDIADWGKAEEYDIAKGCIQSIYSEIEEHSSNKPIILMVPGNHDLDFSHPNCDEKMRELIIDQLSPSNPPNDAMRGYCLSPQEPFRNFCMDIQNKYGTSHAVFAADLIESQSFQIGDIPVSFHLLNTTEFSKKCESIGVSWFPTEILEQSLQSNASSAALTISVMHHPYTWNRLENSKEVRRLLEAYCDIIVTGHEHVPDIHRRSKRTSEQNLYIEGGVLQNHETYSESNFNIITINQAQQTFLVTTFSWDGEGYGQESEPYEHRYLKLRQSLLSEFELQEDCYDWLEQIGTDFRHPRCRELRLSDLFVYPDLQKLDVRKSGTPAGIVRDKDVVGYLQEKKRVLVTGAEKIGKTSLAKRLFLDIREAGLVPLLIGSSFTVSKPNATHPPEERFKHGMNKVLEDTYLKKPAERFWQKKLHERVLIIDDYSSLKLSNHGRDHLLRWADENFGVVVLLADPGIRISEIFNKKDDDTLLWTFEHVSILESDAESRYELIRKWLQLGVDFYQTDENEIYEKSVRYGQIIDTIIGQGVVPSLPLFVFMMLQQIETHGRVDNSAGLYGTLYEVIICDVIKGVATDPADLELKLNYLTELAFALYSQAKPFITDSEFEQWHAQYCNDFNCKLNRESMRMQFEAIGVFAKNEDIGFKYRYYYGFFLARHLANNIFEEHSIEIVENLCRSLHSTDTANILLFLCHQSKDPRILRIILDKAKSHFSGEAEYDLSHTPNVLPAHTIRPANLQLDHSLSPEELRLRSLRQRDDLQRPNGLTEISKCEEASKEGEQINIDLINELNSACHAIRICGQIIRNFYGGMKGELQLEIISECYSVCLRSLTVLFDFLERGKEDIASGFVEVLTHKHPGLSGEELDKKVRRSLYGVALTFSYGLIKHTSSSLGLAALKTSFDKLMERDSIQTSHHLLDISTRLDYFDAFPEKSIQDILKVLKDGLVGHEVLRILVWEHFKLFRSELQIRQRICNKLNIKANQPVLLELKDKRVR